MAFDITKQLKNVSKVKLPGGVVGKVCTVLIVVTLTIGSLAALARETWLLGAAVLAIIIIVFPMLWRLINFADKNPQAAILEGAEFLMHQQIVMASKGNPQIPASVDVSVDDRPVQIPKGSEATLDIPEEPAAQIGLPAQEKEKWMGKFLHIFIDRKPSVTSEQVEQKMNLAVDWYRCHDKVYVIYTTSDVDKWFARLSEFVKPDGHLFICRLDVTDRNGWMKKSFWEWLKKPRKSS